MIWNILMSSSRMPIHSHLQQFLLTNLCMCHLRNYIKMFPIISLHCIVMTYIRSRCITFHYILEHHILCALYGIILHFITLHCFAYNNITLHHVTSHNILSQYTVSLNITIHHITYYIALQHLIAFHLNPSTSHYITLLQNANNYIKFHCHALHSIILPHLTSHQIKLHCNTSHYITIH